MHCLKSNPSNLLVLLILSCLSFNSTALSANTPFLNGTYSQKSTDWSTSIEDVTLVHTVIITTGLTTTPFCPPITISEQTETEFVFETVFHTIVTTLYSSSGHQSISSTKLLLSNRANLDPRLVSTWTIYTQPVGSCVPSTIKYVTSTPKIRVTQLYTIELTLTTYIASPTTSRSQPQSQIQGPVPAPQVPHQTAQPFSPPTTTASRNVNEGEHTQSGLETSLEAHVTEPGAQASYIGSNKFTTVIGSVHVTIETLSQNGGALLNGVYVPMYSVATIDGITVSNSPNGLIALVGNERILLGFSKSTGVPAFGNIPKGDTDLGVVIGDQVLSPGGVAVISGETYFLPLGATKPVVGTALGINHQVGPMTPGGLLVVSGTTYTVLKTGADALYPVSRVFVQGQLLTMGGTLLISGTTYLLPTGATVPLTESPKSVSAPVSLLKEGHYTSAGTFVLSGTTYILRSDGTMKTLISSGTAALTTTPGYSSSSPSNTGPAFAVETSKSAGSKGKSPWAFQKLLIFLGINLHLTFI